MDKKEDFSNSKITFTGKVNIKEVIEFEREDPTCKDHNGKPKTRKVMRVTGIRDSEELMQWEILD